MYELIIGITVCILSATLLCGVQVVNLTLKERGHRQLRIPEEWWT